MLAEVPETCTPLHSLGVQCLVLLPGRAGVFCAPGANLESSVVCHVSLA